MQSAQALATRMPSAIDDLATVNRFYVTVELATGEEVTRGFEILRQREYERCWPVVAQMSEDAGFATVTGYSFRGYDGARENALRFASRHRQS